MRCQKTSKFLTLIILTFFFISMMGMAVSAQGEPEHAVETGVDDDGDGLTNEDEENKTKTDPLSPDTDGDGLTDLYEWEHEGMDPLDPNIPYKLRVFEDKDEYDREEVRDSLLNTALFTFLMGFAVFALLAGAFTAYFGAGKSRAIGAGLMMIGLIVILVWVFYGVMGEYDSDTLLGIVHWEAAATLEAFVTVLAALVGAVAAIGLFLVAIMKS